MNDTPSMAPHTRTNKNTANIGPVEQVFGVVRGSNSIEIPTTIIGAPAAALHVYCYYKLCADRDKPLPKNAATAKACNISPSAVTRATIWLRQEGYLA